MRIYKSFVLSVLAAIGFFVIFCGPVAAQTRSFRGTVTDDKGQPVEDAKVSITGMDIVVNFETKTNKKGEYIYLMGLQSGSFRIVVRKEGFQPAFKENLRPELGEPMVVDFTLEPGSDYPLPWEMTDEQKKAYLKDHEDRLKRKKMAGDIKAAFDAGVALAKQGNQQEAIASFNKALKLDPKEPVIYAAIAKAQATEGQNEQALESYQKAIELDPTNSAFYMNMGVVLSDLGKTEESQAAFKKSAELDPIHAAQSYYNLGATLINNGNNPLAIEAFKQSIAADPTYAEAYYQLGLCLSSDSKTIPEAVEMLKKYVEIGHQAENVDVAKALISALAPE